MCIFSIDKKNLKQLKIIEKFLKYESKNTDFHEPLRVFSTCNGGPGGPSIRYEMRLG